MGYVLSFVAACRSLKRPCSACSREPGICGRERERDSCGKSKPPVQNPRLLLEQSWSLVPQAGQSSASRLPSCEASCETLTRTRSTTRAAVACTSHRPQSLSWNASKIPPLSASRPLGLFWCCLAGVLYAEACALGSAAAADLPGGAGRGAVSKVVPRSLLGAMAYIYISTHMYMCVKPVNLVWRTCVVYQRGCSNLFPLWQMYRLKALVMYSHGHVQAVLP